jgi:hypothetical protein
MSGDWTDRLAGARMQVDQQFQDRVAESDFTSQEWGLIMTAVEFEIDDPDDPEAARLVADTSKFGDIIPELENIKREMSAQQPPRESGGDGILGRLRQLFGSSGEGNATDDERLEEARSLVEAYASALQRHLEARGRWEEIREAAREG